MTSRVGAASDSTEEAMKEVPRTGYMHRPLGGTVVGSGAPAELLGNISVGLLREPIGREYGSFGGASEKAVFVPRAAF